MNLNEMKLPQILVALPLLHLLIVSIFLFSYCAGFGSRIHIFISPTDIFGVSIGDLVWIYGSAIIIPGIVAISQISRPLPYKEDQVNAISDPVVRNQEKKRLARMRKVSLVLAVIMIVGGMCVTYLQFARGGPVIFLAAYIAVLIIGIAWLYWLQRQHDISHITIQFIVIALMCVLNSIQTGLNIGQSERFSDYKIASDKYVYCKSGQVLRKMSEFYLVILPDGRKALVDGECEVKFDIPPPQRIHMSKRA